MILWKASHTYSSPECYTETIIGIFETRAEADEAVLTLYEKIPVDSRRRYDWTNDKPYDILLDFTVEEFQTGTLWVDERCAV